MRKEEEGGGGKGRGVSSFLISTDGQMQFSLSL